MKLVLCPCYTPRVFIPVLCHAKHGQSEGADGETTLKQLVRVRVRVIKDNETRVRFEGNKTSSDNDVRVRIRVINILQETRLELGLG